MIIARNIILQTFSLLNAMIGYLFDILYILTNMIIQYKVQV